jgi:hypothetical protein
MQPLNDNDAPNLAKVLKDKHEPKALMSSTARDAPSLAKARREKEDPMLT